MRVAIVNDVSTITYTLDKILKSHGSLEVAWTAANGEEAVEKCQADTPDLILMDLIMPVMNGVEATRNIMERSPCAILIVTSSVVQNASMVFESMGFGALDAVNTPDISSDSEQAINILLNKIDMIGRLIGKTSAGKSPAAVPPHPAASDVSDQQPELPLVAIGSSTGGPAALATILAEFPADINAAIVIIQHVDMAFAPGMADWLNDRCDIKVRIAETGDTPQAGVALLAATNDHLVMNSDCTLCYTEDPASCVYRPSVDAFYESIKLHWRRDIIAALLTGMGKDGATGLLSLKESGMHTIAQDKESCAVFGMPKAAIAIGAACETLPLNKIGHSILQRLELIARKGQRRATRE